MAYRRQSGMEHVLDTTVRTQAGAVAFGIIGALLVTPLPRMLVEMVPMERYDGPDPNLTGMVTNGYVAAALSLAPWIRILGALLTALAAGSLLIRGADVEYRDVIGSRGVNNAFAIALIGILVAMLSVAPLRLTPDAEETARINARTMGRDMPQVARIDTASFPESGTVQWGPEGQPIGGSLEDLQIWDVTRSPENKVVRIRSGLTMAIGGYQAPPYATIYVQAGQRTSIRLPTGRPWRVTAMAGREWRGDAMFGDDATTVDFGQAMVLPGRPDVVAMGAPDQTANVVPNDRF